MPVIIEQVFTLGRFHATRWNQNPFEDRHGEWPPSPWRFLRALAARWFQYQRETDNDDVRLRDELLRALASELPTFQLPEATWRGQELRHYHPTKLEFQYKKGSKLGRQISTTLVTDTYRAISQRDNVAWVWRQLTISSELQNLLDQLLSRIHYFGRAESIVSMRLVHPAEGEAVPNCILRPEASSTSAPVLAARPDSVLDIDLLLAITDDKRLANAPLPRGTAWYYADLPRVPRPKPTIRLLPSAPSPHVIRFALDSTVLPLLTETLPVAEAARRALMSWHGRLTEKNGIRGRSDVLAGKDEQGNPLMDHRHAYYLPTDEDGDGRLDHLTVSSIEGFGPDERRAFDCLRELRTNRVSEERHPLRVLLLGMGAFDEQHSGPIQVGEIWVSATPYIATRYAKTRGRNRIDMASPEARATFLCDDIRRQLSSVMPDFAASEAPAVLIEPLWDTNHVFKVAARWSTIQFKRFRHKAGDDGGRHLCGAFKLTFPRPVRGPVALGWSNHFGMGLFVPLPSQGTHGAR